MPKPGAGQSPDTGEATTPGKSDAAYRTIGELSRETGLPAHVLRYWETRFTQLRPITRAGNRRYYRAADVALVRRIQSLLGPQGYTVRGVQKLLASEAPSPPAPAPDAVLDAVRRTRDALAAALADD